MNGGISDTITTPTGQTNDPAALLNTLMASAGGTPPSTGLAKILPSGLGGDALSASAASSGGTLAGTLKDGIFGYGYYDDATGTFTPAERPGGTTGGAAGGTAGGPGPGQNGYLWSDGTFHATPEPSAGGTTGDTAGGTAGGTVEGGRARKKWPPGEGSVNEDARKRGEALTAFLASFQAAFQRQNPNFNFTRNQRLAAGLGLPWSGDLGR